MRQDPAVEHEVMPARCPLDGTELLPANPDGACGCPTCRGVWLPGPLVSTCVGEPVTMALKRKVGAATPLSCPDDQLNLMKIRYHGISLDLCRECCGVWFDRRDLDAIHQHRSALGIRTDGEFPVYVKREDGEGAWDESLIHFILFASRG
jgi:Zn-finger nucleic acid-binding protein